MDEIAVTFPGGKRVAAHFEGRDILTDQPRDAGGEDSAPSPFELFLAAMGTCAGIYVLGFCQRRGLSTEGIRLAERLEFDPSTHVLAKVHIDIEVPPSFPEKYHEPLVRAAEQCAVKKAIQAQPAFEVKTVVK